VLPWSEFWDHNYFAVAWPSVRSVVTNDFVRGGVSGLGIVNLVVGVVDLTMVLSARGRAGMSFGDGTGQSL
jgi:hypothetical protein